MTQEKQTPVVMTVGELRRYLGLYCEDLPVTVELASGELQGVLEASTAVMQPGPVLVFRMSTIRTTADSRKVEPVIVSGVDK